VILLLHHTLKRIQEGGAEDIGEDALLHRRFRPGGFAAARSWEELGMRPLETHYHPGLGTLSGKMGQQEEARTE